MSVTTPETGFVGFEKCDCFAVLQPQAARLSVRLRLFQADQLATAAAGQRRVRIAMASACPTADEWARAARRLAAAAKARAAPV
jgi:hypothetical protein